MILSSPLPWTSAEAAWLLVGLTVAMYLLSMPRRLPWGRWAAPCLLGGLVLHAVLLATGLWGLGAPAVGARLGFGPMLSMTAWLVLAVYLVESRLLPLPRVRRWLGLAGAAAVVLTVLFPGDTVRVNSGLAPLHFALGVASYGLLASAVVHALMLDGAERRLRAGPPAQAATDGEPASWPEVPLLRLERLTFNFVGAGFVALSATLALGLVTAPGWRWDHKTLFGVLAWLVFAALLAGRHWRGWRGRRATRWLYLGALLLLLAYVGSRFVVSVLLGR